MRRRWTKDELIAFETDIAQQFEAKRIAGPVHLSGGNEDELISLFRAIHEHDWIFSTYRSHYHALLHGVPKEDVRREIMAGRSMNLVFTQHHFYTSAIVGSMLSIATGTAAGLKHAGSTRRVWCFVGDMAASTGAFHEAHQYAVARDLPITFVIEDNGLSTNTPTTECWGAPQKPRGGKIFRYDYVRTWPHVGSGTWVQF